MSHNKIVVSGTFDSTPETFSFGVNYASASDTGTSDQAELTAWASACGDWLSGATTDATVLRSLISTALTIRKVQVYYYPNESGDPAGAVGESLEAINGSTTVRQAPQVAACVTLNTGVPGKRTRGRIYLPAQGATVSSTMKWSGGSPTPTQVSLAVAGMLEAFSVAAPFLTATPMVLSTVGGFMTPVISVAVGDVLDTQRSRRGKLQEIKVSSPVS